MEKIKFMSMYFLVGILVTCILIVMQEPNYIISFLINGIIGVILGSLLQYGLVKIIDLSRNRLNKFYYFTMAAILAVLVPMIFNAILTLDFNVMKWVIEARYFLIIYIPFILLVTYGFYYYTERMYINSNDRLREIQNLHKVGESNDGEDD